MCVSLQAAPPWDAATPASASLSRLGPLTCMSWTLRVERYSPRRSGRNISRSIRKIKTRLQMSCSLWSRARVWVAVSDLEVTQRRIISVAQNQGRAFGEPRSHSVKDPILTATEHQNPSNVLLRMTWPSVSIDVGVHARSDHQRGTHYPVYPQL